MSLIFTHTFNTYGSTKIHEVYFNVIPAGATSEHFELRPNANKTCVFKVTF
jgi:hypothetical protein